MQSGRCRVRVTTPTDPTPPSSSLPTAPPQHPYRRHHDSEAGSSEQSPPISAQLTAEINAAREGVPQCDSVAEAESAGCSYISSFGSSGAHLVNGDLISEGFSIDRRAMWLAPGREPSDPIVGISDFSVSEVASRPPAAFASPDAAWHYHGGSCVHDGPLTGLDVDPRWCVLTGGSAGIGDGWMIHVWVVPRWENPAGIFAEVHPRA